MRLIFRGVGEDVARDELRNDPTGPQFQEMRALTVSVEILRLVIRLKNYDLRWVLNATVNFVADIAGLATGGFRHIREQIEDFLASALFSAIGGDDVEQSRSPWSFAGTVTGIPPARHPLAYGGCPPLCRHSFARVTSRKEMAFPFMASLVIRLALRPRDLYGRWTQANPVEEPFGSMRTADWGTWDQPGPHPATGAWPMDHRASTGALVVIPALHRAAVGCGSGAGSLRVPTPLHGLGHDVPGVGTEGLADV